MQLISFYQFLSLDDLPLLRDRIRTRAERLQLKGTVLLAGEGINGSLAGAADAPAVLLRWLESEIGCYELIRNTQKTESMPFKRLKVRIRPEIIRFDMPDPALARRVGEHVRPAEWNALIEREDVRLLDVRNAYEVALGTFDGAVNPRTETFGQFARWVDDNLDPAIDRHVAMYCTGGVRCEKASAWMRSRGFDNVYQLEGGILSYLHEVPVADSRWRGECFVFDDRVSLDHELQPTHRPICPGCRKPLEDSPGQSGEHRTTAAVVLCRHCEGTLDATRRRSAAERVRQIALAEARGTTHLGPNAQG